MLLFWLLTGKWTNNLKRERVNPAEYFMKYEISVWHSIKYFGFCKRFHSMNTVQNA